MLLALLPNGSDKTVKAKFPLFVLSLIIVLASIVSAAPPVLSTVQLGSCEIIAPTFDVIPQSGSFDFYWHVFNTTALLTNKTTTCTYHLYSKFANGEHIYTQNPVKKYVNDRDFEVSLKGTNFTNTGEYCDLIECNTTSQACALERCFEVTKTGYNLTPVEISIYIFFLLICLTGMLFSAKLATNNSFEADKLNYQELYEDHKQNEGSFYLKLIKRKMWILGVFGIYLFAVVFLSILSQVVYELNLQNISPLLSNLLIVILWGIIPFVIFWIAYIILFFYKSIAETMKNQFGSDTWKGGK